MLEVAKPTRTSQLV